MAASPYQPSATKSGSTISPRDRVLTALRHQQPDRVPVDFLATPEIWGRLIERFNPDTAQVGASDYYDVKGEALLRMFEVDCRLLSYDMFCNPPELALYPGAKVNWWDALSRSTPNRMWRQFLPDGNIYDIWGHHIRIAENQTGAYEEFATWPLSTATSVEDLKSHPWPTPDWWDFSPLPDVIRHLNRDEKYHIRFRIGSVFELAWQLRGMQEFLIDIAADPDIPLYIMQRMNEVHVENLKRALAVAGDLLDMVYFYDDVATQNSLMISQKMWRDYVRPLHEQIIAVAKSYNKPVMYHCDGAIYPLIPELIDMGVDLLNPIQTDAKGMAPERLKAEFGHKLSFHGGIDIIKTLPEGTTEDVANEVRARGRVLGKGGGYILASSHHIQSDTPLENVITMYDPSLRYTE